ncbi:hypothetical protein [Serratia quinivorans]
MSFSAVAVADACAISAAFVGVPVLLWVCSAVRCASVDQVEGFGQ